MRLCPAAPAPSSLSNMFHRSLLNLLAMCTPRVPSSMFQSLFHRSEYAITTDAATAKPRTTGSNLYTSSRMGPWMRQSVAQPPIEPL
jgi:hypothetical protein